MLLNIYSPQDSPQNNGPKFQSCQGGRKHFSQDPDKIKPPGDCKPEALLLTGHYTPTAKISQCKTFSKWLVTNPLKVSILPAHRVSGGRGCPAHPHLGVLSGRGRQVSPASLSSPAASRTSTQVPQPLAEGCQNSLQPAPG